MEMLMVRKSGMSLNEKHLICPSTNAADVPVGKAVRL